MLCEWYIRPVKSLYEAGCFEKSLEQGLKSRQGLKPESLTFGSAVGLTPIVSASSGILPESCVFCAVRWGSNPSSLASSGILTRIVRWQRGGARTHRRVQTP